jgi:oxygen-independent coproporphyrinogen-3 oxidase
MVDALCKEITIQKDFFKSEPINTIYFGGGTPSLLSVADISLLINKINKHFTLSADAEITLEANPDDVTKEKLLGWKGEGINRLSVGVQSFFEEELKWMNRAHNALQAYTCIEEILGAGFTNFSIDLIYGSPLLTDEGWQKNVATALSYNIPHLSCYALTVEEKTPLHKQIMAAKKVNVDNEKQARQFLLLMHWLKAAGYEHYEVSNFAKPGLRSRHNSSYWQGDNYLGVGPSAHSFTGQSRHWNIANNQQYIKSINNGILPKEEEQLTDVQQLNEYIMIAIRTVEGLDLDRVTQKWGTAKKAVILKQIIPYVNSKLVKQHKEVVQLTDEGMLRADGIASDLFFSN